MYLELTEEQKIIKETARSFATSELEPIASELDKGNNKDAYLNNIKKLADLGFMGLNIKNEYGGAEAGVVAFSLVISEIGRACASTAVTVSVSNMVCEVIEAIRSEQQKEKYISKICSGEYLAGSFALSEAGAGSDPSSMTVSAVLDGAEWVLNGTKLWTTSAPYAGVFVVWAVTDKNAPRGKGISCFLVDAGTSGLKIGREEDKLGQQASSTNEVIFENCKIPKDALLGQLNDGFKIALIELSGGRIGVGSLALGIGLAAMDYAAKYSLERKQFNHKISDFQAIQWMIADSYTELEAARLLLMSASFKKENNKSFSKEASMAKMFSTETANKACYNAMQIMGGYGYTKDFPLERYYRDVRVTSIYEGTNEIQRVIIARDILKSFQN